MPAHLHRKVDEARQVTRRAAGPAVAVTALVLVVVLVWRRRRSLD